MSDQRPVPGQRWVSQTEPELGLGVLLEADKDKITLLFAAAGEKRIYSLESAPLLRVIFKKGDTVDVDGELPLTIEKVTQADGLLTYEGSGRTIPEGKLSDSISFSKPEERLQQGQVDDLRTFELRAETLIRSRKILSSEVRGLLGGRIDLIPHQISIAQDVSSRPHPRVLLADEVGLGKTIEACLILHRLQLTGRAERVLILVPEPLIHQWFVELLRRFNLLFALFDEERCQSIVANDPTANPFADSQLVLCSVDFLLENPKRIPQVIDANWDLLIVDEAHHLEWTPDESSEGYELVETLALVTPSVLLLTATPQQLGVEGHFARLRLLDPERYNSLHDFLTESNNYETVADAVDLIAAGKPLKPEMISTFEKRSEHLAKRLRSSCSADEKVRDLLDSFGTGRVMFRNTRKQLSGFPERKAHLVELEGDEFEAKIDWLISLLSKLPNEKVLLICKTIDLVEQISEALRDRIMLKTALFHEEFSLLQRDRNAAYFAEEDGARLLICSEIGSEGRNFQFSHHLVLFDLPENPELLEQRIGRLDRIGQTETINIHVPYVRGERSERYARWYHEGLNAFEKNLQGAQQLVKKLQQLKTDTLADFITASQELRAETEQEMERGYDRLLALASRGDSSVDELLEELDEWDCATDFEDWILRLFDHFGLHVEEHGQRTYGLHPGNVITDAFPDLPEDGMQVTFDRRIALSREEITFMSADHPMVVSAVDLLLSGEDGNSVFGVWEAAGERSVILEAYFVVETVAPKGLQADRFLPPTPIRVVTDISDRDLSKDRSLLFATLRKGAHAKILSQPKVTQVILPKMLKQLEGLTKGRREEIIAKGNKRVVAHFRKELERLKNLAALNPEITQDDLDRLRERGRELEEVLQGARIRLDSLRMIYKTPA